MDRDLRNVFIALSVTANSSLFHNTLHSMYARYVMRNS